MVMAHSLLPLKSDVILGLGSLCLPVRGKASLPLHKERESGKRGKRLEPGYEEIVSRKDPGASRVESSHHSVSFLTPKSVLPPRKSAKYTPQYLGRGVNRGSSQLTYSHHLPSACIPAMNSIWNEWIPRELNFYLQVFFSKKALPPAPQLRRFGHMKPEFIDMGLLEEKEETGTFPN